MVTITVFFSLRVFTKTFIAPLFCREDCKTRPNFRIIYQKLTVNRDVRRRMGIVYLMRMKMFYMAYSTTGILCESTIVQVLQIEAYC